MRTLLLTDQDVKDLLSMREVIDAVENAFKEKALGRAQMPPKVYLFYGNVGDLRTMPCYLESLGISSVKIVNSHPRNREKGLPTVMATIILLDPETGFPRAIMGGTWITAMRTGAAGAIAAKYLAKRSSKVAAFIGAGVQARFQLMGLMEVAKSLEEVRVFDVNPEAERSFVKFFEENYLKNCPIVMARSCEEAVRDADIIVTTTPSRNPVIKNEWIREGVHFNCMGADAPGKEELDPKILKRASKIVVDDFGQAVHGGEINVPISKGIISESDLYGEIGEIIAGLKKGRENDEEITIFTSTGLAIQDAVTAHLAYEKAVKKNLGVYVKLVG
ncbi:alanine dehydrogenase [Candidatus Bathyarchaeota archaeon]|nr:alanine dehydrogenase [Candidatus Bathyarchaeota archaeon]